MFNKTTNIIIIAVFALSLFSVVGTKALDKMGVAFPEWAEIGVDKSSLEGRAYTVMPEPSVESISSGAFQKQFEKWIADRIPVRDGASLATAAIQRQFIAAANFAFGFSTYPTYFGSEMSVMPAEQLIIPTASSPNSSNAKAAEEFSELLNELAIKHPETHFVLDAIESPYNSKYNPTYWYKSNHYDYEWVAEHVLSKVDSSNVDVIFDPITSFEELRSIWFTTEHHWTLARALRSYNLIAEKLNLKHFEYENEIRVVSTWYGACCRYGRDLDYSSDFFDMPTDFSSIEWITLDGRAVPYGKRDSFLSQKEQFATEPVFNVYDDYYGTLGVTGFNNDENNGRTCLVICVSYARALKGYIASNYNRTDFLDPVNSRIDKPLSVLLDEEYDDVIIQLATGSYSGIKNSSPKFLG